MKKARNKKRIPLRLCLISREKLPRQALVRIVAKDGLAFVDHSGKASGRGAWVSANPEWIQKIRKSRAIERVLNCNCDLAFFETLEKAMQDRKVYLDKFYDLKRNAELEQEKNQQEAEKKQLCSQRDKDAFIVSISRSLQEQEKQPKKTVVRKIAADKSQAFLEAERKKRKSKAKVISQGNNVKNLEGII